MRSYDSAITARTPSNSVPFAAQSRDEPEPYSLPAKIINGVFWLRYDLDASKIVVTGASGLVKSRVKPPSVPGANWLRRRTLANVPRIITSWLPRREPYELKSARSTLWLVRY